jgi:hypothetical protein
MRRRPTTGARRLANAVVDAARSLPPLLRTGGAVLALGLAADLAYHASGRAGGHAAVISSGGLVIHAIVGVGAAISLVGLFVQATTVTHRHRPEGDH